ncbi:hypothetical protein BAY61_19325 [Prauserella marina]|uniref:Uncharacterized protein n=1 Tax=Prauserella marina TaxID=530584 RepID=A0A222VSH0_9PSEU|nr:DUF6401 family natural product biosynthesis protein [Prauserella marina]ASR36792.1 hypothetical protein BAY61_19325 [Prauserella marina]PWV80308.1 hypothetical protein DES30_103399 [Prauserella marina]SDD51467.1 hypothetical protein SAMN05421630_109184 [Prauserella marina]
MGWLSSAWHESAARRELTVLADRLRNAGLTPGGLSPGALATVDQHAAAVRDILTLSGGRAGPVELAGYARGVQDAARDSGWFLRKDESPNGDWISLRLIAVCLLATEGVTLVSGGDLDPLLFS